MDNIINFENNKYVWEEISGKGKCLVPYVETNPFLVKDSYGNYRNRGAVFKIGPYKFAIVVGLGNNVGIVGEEGNALFFGEMYTSMEELAKKHWDYCKKVGYKVEYLGQFCVNETSIRKV